MSLSRLPKSDRRVILTLCGLITLLVTISILHRQSIFYTSVPEDSLSHEQRYQILQDSFALQKAERQQEKERREARYQALQDSFAQLKAEREQRKAERESRYLAMKDSFARIKAERQQRKIERELKEQRWHDSINALRPQKLSPGETIELNSADSLLLLKVPGIGKALSAAILRYREQLGGFYQANQILEVKGVPTQALAYITVVPHTRKMNLNALTLSQLQKHPYLNFYQAKAILEYRRKYGHLKNLEQLSLLDEFPLEQLNRLRPYVQFE